MSYTEVLSRGGERGFKQGRGIVKSVLQKNATMLISLLLNSAHLPLLGISCYQAIPSIPFPIPFIPLLS